MPLEVSVQLKDPRWKALLKPYCKTVEATCAAAFISSPSRGEVRRGAKGTSAVKQRPHPNPPPNGEGNYSMAVVLANDDFVQDLNATYRSKDKPTNVLSFPDGEEGNLGDVVLAYDTLEREAKEQGKKLRDHAIHLLVHGTLHLQGHDHMKAKEAEAMEALEIKILKSLGVANPYL